MVRLTFDIETNGFLEHVTKLHCIVVKDLDTGKVFTNLETPVVDLLKMLMAADVVIGQNITKFDIPVLTKLFPWFQIKRECIIDTLVCTRLIWANIGESDNTRLKAGTLPSKMFASHSLEAWGYRLGLMKGEYTKDFIAAAGDDYEPGDEWLVWSQEMHDYCLQDVEVTEALYKLILTKNYSPVSLALEHFVAWICAKMERNGWPFDKEKAVLLWGQLEEKKQKILAHMRETFEPDVESGRTHKTTGKPLADKVYPFNPGSRKQIADRLRRKYGWKPTQYTDSGQVKIDETILGTLPYPEAKILTEYFLLEKRLGMIADGENAWIKLERNGRIHGGYNPNSAITGRNTHSRPNLGQVPAVRSPYGKECRELFTVPKGWRLVGVDQSGIELRLLAHYMFPYDQGAYARAVVQGKQSEGTDVHTLNMRAFGFHSRDSAKTGIYAMLYGAAGLLMFGVAYDDYLKAGIDLKKQYKTEGSQRKFGDNLIGQFLERTPALGKLRKAVSAAAKRGFLTGLDGRSIHIRHAHAALNSLLQGAGAVAAKQWLVEIVKAAEGRGWVWSEDWSGDYCFCGWIHDEVQIAVRAEIAEEFGAMVVKAAADAGVALNIRVPVGAECGIGITWADTH
jgi:DNA polymerase-1